MNCPGETFEVSTHKLVRPDDPNTLVYKGDTDWSQTDPDEGDTFVISFGDKELTVGILVEEKADHEEVSDNEGDDDSEDSDNDKDHDDKDDSTDELNEGVKENNSKWDRKSILTYEFTLSGDKADIPEDVKKICWCVSFGNKICFLDVVPQEEPKQFSKQSPPKRYTQMFSERHIDGFVVSFEIHVDRDKPRQSVLHEGLESLLKDKCLTDAKLVCGIKEIPCHKIVLAALSPVFKNQLSGGRAFRESRDGKIKITDFKFEEVEVAVKFLYNNEAKCIEQHAERLLIFAHKYDIQVLYSACETYLTSTLRQDTAVDLLKFAIEAHSDHLKFLPRASRSRSL
jgi:hypothetical protein